MDKMDHPEYQDHQEDMGKMDFQEDQE